jgi:hypothetical protein
MFDTDEYTEERLVTPEELLELIHNENDGELGECPKTFLKSEGII